MMLAADRINVVEGIGQDLARGKVPNIPAEMGVRSEIQYNMPGLVRKTVIASTAVAVLYALIRSA